MYNTLILVVDTFIVIGVVLLAILSIIVINKSSQLLKENEKLKKQLEMK